MVKALTGLMLKQVYLKVQSWDLYFSEFISAIFQGV